jgi:altronate dehydratase large subunit
MYNHLEDDMDINAGVILDGSPMKDVGDQIIEIVVRVLNGEPTKAELNQQEGIVCLYSLTPAF